MSVTVKAAGDDTSDLESSLRGSCGRLSWRFMHSADAAGGLPLTLRALGRTVQDGPWKAAAAETTLMAVLVCSSDSRATAERADGRGNSARRLCCLDTRSMTGTVSVLRPRQRKTIQNYRCINLPPDSGKLSQDEVTEIGFCVCR